MTTWTVPVKENEAGELYIELNDDILEGSGFEIGDKLKWTDLKDGSFSLTKDVDDMDIYIVETVSTFAMKYAIRAKSAEHAMDTVVMEEVNDISQKHVGENIVRARKVTKQDYLEEFDQDNDYLRDWSEDQKLNMVTVIDYNK